MKPWRHILLTVIQAWSKTQILLKLYNNCVLLGAPKYFNSHEITVRLLSVLTILPHQIIFTPSNIIALARDLIGIMEEGLQLRNFIPYVFLLETGLHFYSSITCFVT